MALSRLMGFSVESTGGARWGGSARTRSWVRHCGRGGRFWLDDWSIEEIGPVNVLRRPGTPVTVKSEDGTVYEEGKDYLPLEDFAYRPYRVNREACRGRDMAELLGECVRRQIESLRRHNPGIEVYIRSDMFDPNHNAHGDYYLVDADFTGSWKHVPRDVIMAVWGGAPRPQSLKFFADQGFPMLIACYYDANDLTEVRGWLREARDLPSIRGLMYTPWTKRYDLLPEFGRLISGPSAR